MPDQLPVAEGGRSSGGGGLASHWKLIGGIAGVGVVAILLMKDNSGGGNSTTAAGTSINAALGSIQEQNLNLMGQLGASTAALSSQASQFNQSELAAMSGMQEALGSQISGIDAHLTDVNNSLSSQLSDVNGNVIANGQASAAQYAALTAQGAALSTQVSGMQQQVLNSIAGVSSGMDQYYQSIVQYFQTVVGQYNALSGQITSGQQASEQQYNALYSLGQFINDAMGKQFGAFNQRLGAKGI